MALKQRLVRLREVVKEHYPDLVNLIPDPEGIRMDKLQETALERRKQEAEVEIWHIHVQGKKGV